MIKNKILAMAVSIVLIASMMASIIILPNTIGQVYFPKGYDVPTYAYINVAPNPIGVGQTATVNFFLATPMETGERPTNMTVFVIKPDGTTQQIGGNFTGDQTGGTFTTFVPDVVGTYQFYWKYGGQTLVGAGQWNGLHQLPSESAKVSLTVQQEPITKSAFPITPLPTEWWQTPVSAENVEEWYKIMGPWLGYGSVTFATTGGYNVSSFCNPYTPSVNSGHVLWTKVWAEGGPAGGDAGGTQSSHYWSTRQYQPQYAPVIINGIMYSQQFDTTMGTNMGQGIQAVDLYTGKTLWTINTTNTLRCGQVTLYNHINQYGAIGPFIWTTGTLPAGDTGGTQPANTGTQWNMYDALTGSYVLSIVNGSALTLRTDESGNMIGYFINNTAGTEIVHPLPGVNEVVTNTGPHLTCVNMTMAIGQTGGSFQPARNTVRAMSTGYMWSKPVPTNITAGGITTQINPAVAIMSITGDAVVLAGGFIHGQGVGGETAGWLVLGSMDQDTGNILTVQNLTYAGGAKSLLPFTRTSFTYGQGMFYIMNDVNYAIEAYDVKTGARVWSGELKGDNGAPPNSYDLFSLKPYVGTGVLYVAGLGGDLWAFDSVTGTQKWYTNTTKLVGDPGIESPYGIWPLWVFNCAGFTNDVAYFPIGHEYNPPLFHGAQMLAINASTGELVWSELGTYIRSTSIAYGIMLSMNAYDNQIYAFGKGPSQTTISAPDVGVTTGTPITITGRVTDIAAGTKQDEIALRFPNGVPAVSDASQSKFMEYVYQKQTMPLNITGVPVTISVVDSNGNYRVIGQTQTDASGTYGFTWTPDISGGYQITASFTGSESYYKSQATTYFHASEAAPTSTTQPVSQQADPTMTILVAAVAIIIAIAVATVVIVTVVRKRP